MNLPHLHLLLNHVPTVGTVVAIGLMLLSILRKDEGLKRASLEVLCVVALLTLPAYLTGLATKAVIEELPGVAAPAIDQHHDAALVASFVMLLAGGAAWLTLWHGRRAGRTPPSGLTVTLLLASTTLVLMGGVGTVGGEIRHPEIVAEGAAAVEGSAGSSWLSAAALASLVNDHTYVWPAMETLHFIALWLLFGVIVLVNARLLGGLRTVAFSALHRLLPWVALALGVNVITGMMFFIAAPSMYTTNVPFYWKMGLLLLAGANLLYLTTFDEPWTVGAGGNVPARAKVVAITSLGLWVGVMFFGRMLPFLGNSF